jgi:hypothetical protein
MKQLIILTLIACAFLLGCDKAEDGKNSLIDLIIEPKGENCATGGHKVLTGLDTNGDGILQTTEVQNTKYVCNGLDGKTTLLSAVAEQSGSNCTTGGYKLNSGVDINGNAVLDASEINSTQYICNGLTGSNSLISVVAESAGENCATGGYRLSSGVDGNKNGTLESTEIQSSKYICNGTKGINYLIGVVAQPPGSNCTYGGYRFNTGIDINNNGTLDNSEILKSDYICYNAPSLSYGLIAHWPFNGNGSDISGNSRTATVNNMVTTTDRFGNSASAYQFNGFSSYATVADHSALRLSNTDFTLNAWVKLNSYNLSYGSIIFSKHIVGVDNGWGWSVSGYSSNPLGVNFFGPGGGSVNAWGAASISLNSWHMLTTVYNDSTRRLSFYIDGVLDNTNTIQRPNGTITTALHIGKDSALSDYFLHGSLDDLRIYSRAISSDEIQQLYNSSN